MPKLSRSFFPAVLLAALCSSFAMAQVEPGSLDDLLEADFAPFKVDAPLKPSDQQLPDLYAPLVMSPPTPQSQELSPKVPIAPVPQVAPVPQTESLPQLAPPPRSVLELPRVTPDEPAPEALMLPEVTMPTPENTGAVLGEDRRVLRPQLDVPPGDQIELLPFDDRDSIQARKPQMRSPRALPYGNSALGSNTYGSSNRSAFGSRLAVPLQIEFFSVTQRYVPYGGYGYRSYGSYRSGYAPRGYRPTGYGYGGGGRDCSSRR